MASLAQLQPPSLALASGVLFLGAFLLYRWLLPKPISGIPYNAEATKTIFGDIPGLLEHLKHSEQVTDWMEGHNLRHNSPIIQVFLKLFQKPVVMINDFKESQDILMHRGKEFDKPDMISDLLYGIAREHHSTLNHSALEAIWAALFGIGETATITQRQTDLLSPLHSKSVKTLPNGALEFPEAARASAFDSILRLTDIFEGVTKSPFPRIYGSPRVSTFSQMIAEMFGLLIAGHDTTVTMIMWTMKQLAGHPDVQFELRNELRESYSAAFTEGRVPATHEIVNTPVHYLDACIEELVRCSQTAPVTSRIASTNAVVLGHVIPKGTRGIMMGRSAGILKPSHKIPDSLRSPTFHNAGGGKIGAWDESSPEEMLAFNPERWLKTEANGSRVFDATLSPHLSFGAGPRGCFGRKLAYLELRFAIVLVLWHFELQKVPEHLDSYEPIEQLTHNPLQCYVKLAPAP
ncbi:hypothetical protein E8E11_010563 [Didymella keratinophila]|nr:hypothetical protein E8E11_010563 [Didymella keratinophila]